MDFKWLSVVQTTLLCKATQILCKIFTFIDICNKNSWICWNKTILILCQKIRGIFVNFTKPPNVSLLLDVFTLSKPFYRR